MDQIRNPTASLEDKDGSGTPKDKDGGDGTGTPKSGTKHDEGVPSSENTGAANVIEKYMSKQEDLEFATLQQINE